MKDIHSKVFGISKTGEVVYLYILENDHGIRVQIINYACAIQSIFVPDKHGRLTDVVLGYDSLEEYESRSSFFGAFVGRYANRIKRAQFELNGKTYFLPQNDGANHLHGTYTERVFPAEIAGDRLVFHGVSPDGEEGFPGTLTFDVTYQLTDENELLIDYVARSDADTVVNFTNHSYFNLNGNDGSTILSHTLQLNADFFTEGDRETLPTGVIKPVDGTPMDFRIGKKISEAANDSDEQIRMCQGIDHNFVLADGASLKLAGVLQSEATGIAMHCYTTQPGVQIYTGNFLEAESGKYGVTYPQYGAICLETQHFPCSPNYPQFPSTLLKAGEVYAQRTIYQFNCSYCTGDNTCLVSTCVQQGNRKESGMVNH